MSDLALVGPIADLAIVQNDLATDPGLETAALLSLFCDARKPSVNTLDEDPRGWWGDEFGEVKYGSLLWTLAREKPTPETAKQAERYAAAALAWMVKFKIADSVRVSASFSGQTMQLEVQIKRPGRQSLTNRYALNWAEYGRSYGLAA